jgi:hypothetical protein
VTAGITRLRDRYGENICSVFNLMLKFYEKDRPSFVELHKMMMQQHEYAQYECENRMRNAVEATDGGLQVQSRPMLNRTNSPTDPSANVSNLNVSNN